MVCRNLRWRKDFVPGEIGVTFWAVTIPVAHYGLRAQAGSGPLSRDFWELPHQCHVMERMKMREDNLNTGNEFSKWLRIIGHRRTQTYTGNLLKVKSVCGFPCGSVDSSITCEQDQRKKGNPER